jgi:hypothetical protein
VKQSNFTIMSPTNTIKQGNFCVKISQVCFHNDRFYTSSLELPLLLPDISTYSAYCCQISLHILPSSRNVASQFYYGWYKMLYSDSYCINRSRVVGTATMLRGGRSGVRTPVGVRDFLFSTTFISTPGLTQPPINGYRSSLSEGKRAGAWSQPLISI